MAEARNEIYAPSFPFAANQSSKLTEHLVFLRFFPHGPAFRLSSAVRIRSPERARLSEMILICVHKSWLDTIGKVADLLVSTKASDEYVSMLAASAEVESSFVEAKLARREALAGEWFLRASIPVNLVSGMFDMTKEETKHFGFHPPDETAGH